MRNSIQTVFFASLLLAPAAWAQTPGDTNYTFSTAEIDTYNTTNVTEQVNTFQVELKARMQGGAYLFDQTYNVAFSDPTVQAAIAQAKNLLTNAGAASFAGPAQLSSTQSTSSATNTVQTGKVLGQLLSDTHMYLGPVTVYIDDHGICQSYTLGDAITPPQLTGCSKPGQPFALLGGQVDFDTLTIWPYTINQTATTTNTTLTTQVYELDGVPVGNPPTATPAPPSLILALTGMAASGLYAVRRRLRRES